MIRYIIILGMIVLNSCSNGTADESLELSANTAKNLKTVSDLSYRNIDNVQSPINLQISLAKEHQYQIDFRIKPELKALLRKSHTVELKIEEGSTIEVFYHKYTFKQLHFHTPAEHSFNKVKHPMEMHLVSVKIDTLEPDLPKYLVVGITFKEGNENSFIQSVIDKVPHVNPNDLIDKNGEHSEFSLYVDLANHPINLNNLFGDNIENHLDNLIHYKGSLTTYPFTESVEWYMLKEVVEVSKEQIKEMNIIMGENSRASQEKVHLDYGFDHMFD